MNPDSIVEHQRKAVALLNRLPSDLRFYSAIDGNVKSELEDVRTDVSSMLGQLSAYLGTNLDFSDASASTMDAIVEIFDRLFEQVDRSLDEIIHPDSHKTALAFTDASSSLAHVAKPQVAFGIPVDNSPAPFVPTRSNIEVKTEGAVYAHPFTDDYILPDLFDFREVLYPPIKKTSLTYVDTPEQLDHMLTVLKSQTEIAVDLEAHSHRSYQGITCLMQISTRTEDYIVDTLVLWDYMPRMNEIFADNGIVKVLHGAEHDIRWLQRDFSVFIRPLFDTYHASRALEMPRYSLSYLLEHYTGVKLDKTHQLSDWRIRPLPTDMLDYARSDTHYLLYVYDRMRRELISREPTLLVRVLEASKITATKIYEKPEVPDRDVAPQPVLDGIISINDSGKRRSLYALLAARLLHVRDSLARRDDESPHYILPKWVLSKCITNNEKILSKGIAFLDSIWKSFSRTEGLAVLVKDTISCAVEEFEARYQPSSIHEGYENKAQKSTHLVFSSDAELTDDERDNAIVAVAPLKPQSALFGDSESEGSSVSDQNEEPELVFPSMAEEIAPPIDFQELLPNQRSSDESLVINEDPSDEESEVKMLSEGAKVSKWTRKSRSKKARVEFGSVEVKKVDGAFDPYSRVDVTDELKKRKAPRSAKAKSGKQMSFTKG